MKLRKTPEFIRWLACLRAKNLFQVEDRLDRIRQHNHFGDRRHLGDDLFELRWANGRRIYYSFGSDGEGRVVLLLLGGDKNGQKRDIAHARSILEREAPNT